MSLLTPAEALRNLPGGLSARPISTSDLTAATELMRAIDIFGSGTTSTNEEESADMFGEPDCRWGQGAAVVHRGADLVGLLVTFDGVESGRGWSFDAYVQPGDPQEELLIELTVRAGLATGQRRWAAAAAAGEVAADGLVAKIACYPAESKVREVLAELGFEEARRFWRMIIEHARPADAPSLPEGYTLRAFRTDDDHDLHLMFEVSNTCFADHFDFTALPYDEWRDTMSGQTEDPTQWQFLEHEGAPAGYVRGSDRFAAEGLGYVASLGVLREHRGRGLAGALLRARFADDVARGRSGTVLHVDSTNPTGATRVYESAGMRVDQEYVFHRRPLLD